MEELSTVQPLSDRHVLEYFDSGSVPIDRWLKAKSRTAVSQKTAKALVADALARVLASNENVAAFALITNATPESRSFYSKLGFKESRTDPTLVILSLVFE